MAGVLLPLQTVDLTPSVLPKVEFAMIASSVAYSVAPVAPTGLLANPVSFSSIQLDWTDNSSNEDGFEIQNSPDGITYASLGTVGASVTTYTDSGLLNNALWYYRVRAYKGAAYSDFTTPASATTWGAPTVLAAAVASDTQINLTWQDNSPTEDSFKVEKSTDNSNWTVAYTTAPNATSQAVTGLSEGVLYYFRVRGAEGAGYSGYSNTATATTNPAAPSGLTCTVPAGLTGQTEIDLTWTDNSHAETGFSLEYSTDSGSNWSVLTSPAANAVSYNHSGLSPNVRYDYRLRAVMAGPAYSAYSSSQHATTNKNFLQTTRGLDYGWMGQPLFGGQIGADTTGGLDYGWMGQPLIGLSNIT